MPFEDSIPDDDTPPGFDAEKVIERWEEIDERGHPLGPARCGGTPEKTEQEREQE